MVLAISAVRGMNDILPEVCPYWQSIEEICRLTAHCYGYSEIRFPIVEQTNLFQRAIGDATDIVEKEMYTFHDRNGDALSLRPEGTASCARAVIQHGLLNNPEQRLWYLGPMFRYERPQKGRYRQFHHFGMEVYGMPGPSIDAELILIGQRLWRDFGIEDKVELQLNTLGTAVCRAHYREKLVQFYQAYRNELDEDSLRRLEKNPLRILDSKNPKMQALNQEAPLLVEHLDPPSQAHFDNLRRYLDAAKVNYVVNPKLVRGLDYYNLTVFEWVTDFLGAQGTICAGGRYDHLIEQLGGKPCTAIGFAMGLERLVLLLQTIKQCESRPHVSFVLVGEGAMEKGLIVAEQLRDQLPRLRVTTQLSGGSFKNQFKRADKSGALFAVVIGEDELKSNQVIVKDLRRAEEQVIISADHLATFFESKEIN